MNNLADIKTLISDTMVDIVQQCSEKGFADTAIKASNCLIKLHALDKETTITTEMPKIIYFSEQDQVQH